MDSRKDLDYDFDSMSDDELSSLGTSKDKFKPTGSSTMPPRPEEKKDVEEVKPMSPRPEEKKDSEEKTTEAKKEENSMSSRPEEKKAEEAKPMSPRPTKGEESKHSSDMSLDELGNKIEDILKEDEKLRSEFDGMDNEKKKQTITRLGNIVKEYNELVEKINTKVNDFAIDDKDTTSMSQDEIVEELRSLQRVNSELRSAYQVSKNEEVKVAIERRLNELNTRYGALVDAYNSKNVKSK